jgi:hypothetical protein
MSINQQAYGPINTTNKLICTIEPFWHGLWLTGKCTYSACRDEQFMAGRCTVRIRMLDTIRQHGQTPEQGNKQRQNNDNASISAAADRVQKACGCRCRCRCGRPIDRSQVLTHIRSFKQVRTRQPYMVSELIRQCE